MLEFYGKMFQVMNKFLILYLRVWRNCKNATDLGSVSERIVGWSPTTRTK
jgi:hypothetical protein